MINSKIRVISSNIGRFLSRGGSIEYFDFALADTTFTAGMAKRAAPGPFAAAPVIQGDWDATGTGDLFTYPLGDAVSGNFKNNFDLTQGTIVLWITPEWDGDDGIQHYIWADSSHYRIIKTAANNLVFNAFYLTLAVSIDASSMVSGTQYCVVCRYDYNNTLDGTNYLSISLNDTHTFGVSSLGVLLSYGTLSIGSTFNGSYPANAIIEGLTVYRRVLYDGTYGTDVGNGDELAQIYAAGSGKDPTEITGSWDVVFCLPTNSSTGAIVTGEGEAWTHPHASNVLGDWHAMNEGLCGPSAVSFNGSTTSINCGSDASLDDLHDGAMTVEAWIRADTAGINVNQRILCKGLLGRGWDIRTVTATGVVVASINCATVDAFSSSSLEIVDNNWHHIAMTWDDASYDYPRIWIDGIEDAATTNNRNGAIISDASDDLLIGNLSGYDRYFNGDMAWVRISDSIRYTDTFVPPIACPTTDGNTVALYAMDEGTGSTVADSSANSNDGTISNGSWATLWGLEGTPVVPYSLAFNGTTTSVNCGSDASLDDLHDAAMTVEAWIRADGWGEGGFGLVAIKDGWALYIDTGNGITAYINCATTAAVSRSGTDEFSPDGLWHHIAMTWDDASYSRPKIWIDGNEVTSYFEGTDRDGAVVSDAAETLFIGINSAGNYAFDGDIGWVRISNNIRYTDTFVPPSRLNPPANDANAVAQYNFRDGAGTTLTDETANSNDGTIANGAWNTVADMSTDAPAKRVYAGGYTIGADAAAEGITQTLTSLTAGQSYVARPVISYEDARAQPIIRIYDETNSANIVDFAGPWLNGVHDGGDGESALAEAAAPYWPASLVGGTIYNITDSSSGTITACGTTITATLSGGTDNDWDDDDVYMIVPPARWVWTEPFTWELPTTARNGSAADCVSMSVQILNGNDEGVFYLHQVECLVNLVDNPSMETGAGDPWIPSGWVNQYAGEGDLAEETTIVHSGLDSVKSTTGLTSGGFGTGNYSIVNGVFYSLGFFFYGDGNGITQFRNDSGLLRRQSDNNSSPLYSSLSDGIWSRQETIVRSTFTGNRNLNITRGTTASVGTYVDDAFFFPLTPVSLTVTPASEANSTESTGLRIDGDDEATQTIANLTATSGHVRWAYTPRHSGDNAPYGTSGNINRIVHLYGDASNYIYISLFRTTWSIRFDDGGGYHTDTFSWSPVVGTTYQMQIDYSATEMTLTIDGTVKATITTAINFATVPTTAYWGSTNAGVSQADATFAAPIV